MLLRFVALLVIATVIMANSLTYEQQFSEFKTKFNKTYETPEKEKERFEIFIDNVKKIETHNEKFNKGEVSYNLGINKFTDLSPEEFKKTHFGYRPQKQ